MSRQPVRVFVATGNSPAFPRLLDEIARLAGDAGSFEFFVQSGFSAERFPDLPGRDFVSREEYRERLGWADLVVCHAGAGTIYEAFLAGHTPIVVPRLKRHDEHINDHQLELARALDRAGHAVSCAEVDGLGELLRAARRRGAPRSGDTGSLVHAVDGALRSERPSRARSGLLRTLGTLWRRSRGGRRA